MSLFFEMEVKQKYVLVMGFKCLLVVCCRCIKYYVTGLNPALPFPSQRQMLFGDTDCVGRLRAVVTGATITVGMCGGGATVSPPSHSRTTLRPVLGI